MRVRLMVVLGLCLAWLCVLPVTYAQLEVELTQGVDAAMPLAIIPFSNEGMDVPGNTTLSHVVTTDLQNSGQFRLLNTRASDASITSVNDIDAAEWKKRGANVVLLGSVHPSARGRYQVSIQLVDLYHQQQADSKSAPDVILQQQYTVKKADLRLLAHKISDAVYQKLTGVRGVFATKIAYVLVTRSGHTSRYQLIVADADGFNPQALLTSLMPIMSPTWVDDGQHMVYVSFEGHQAAIYWQDIATGKRRLISRFPGINGAPAVSPDGKKMALVLTKTGSPKIYVMDLSSKALTQITKGRAIDTEPAWAPDGNSLLFTSNRGGSPQIYQYVFDTGHVQRITFDGNYNARASFMPQKNTIVMMHREQGLFGIARQNLTTGRVEVLARSGSDESPSVAPNGRMVLYAMQYGGRSVLAVVSSDGYIKLRLPAQDGSVQEPAWSPFLG
jgi:TolB protein